MKLISNDEVILGNTGEGSSFSIATSAKAFQILSSGIYKHKIRAIVREVSCNANDAHIFGSQSKPWTIKAPTDLDARFVVRDFGPGLSHEDMTTVYTRYFESTKAEDSTQTGAFGLGAKSPFSYTNTFSVTSWFDGVCRIYNAMIVNGAPQLALVFEGPFEDGDQTGIEVVVPVDTRDISKWQYEISKMLRPFKIGTYKLTGMQLTQDPFETRSNYNLDWFGAPQTSSTDSSGLYAIYANIVYPLDGMFEGCEWLLAKNAVTYIHFGPDTLNPQPSREELQDDDYTIKNVRERLYELNERVLQADIAELQSITNGRELLRRVNKLPSAHYDALEKAGTKFYNGTTIGRIVSTQNLDKLTDLKSKYTLFAASTTQPLVRNVVKERGWRNRHSRTKVLPFELFGYPVRKVFVLIQDEARHLRHNIRGLTLSTDSNTPTSNDYVIALHTAFAEEVLSELKRVMSEDEIHVFKSSECEVYRKLIPGYGVKAQRSTSTRPSQPNVTHWQLNGTYWSSSEHKMSTEDIAELSGYVIGMHGTTYTVKSSGFATLSGYRGESTFRNALYNIAGITEFYCVRPTVFKRAARNDNLICVLTEVAAEGLELQEAITQDQYFHKPTSGLAERIVDDERLVPLAKALGLEKEYDMHTKEIDDYEYYFGRLTAKNAFRTDTPIETIQQVTANHRSRVMMATEIYQQSLAKLEEKNKVAYFALVNAYGEDLDDLADPIMKLLGVK